jgi:TAT (twin-arginine translocation) pathway signal sequence.
MALSKFSRREFLKYSLASGAGLSLTGSLNGCTTFALLSDTVVPMEELKLPDIECDKGVYLKNCNIIDVKNGQVIKGSAIKIGNKKIEEIWK